MIELDPGGNVWRTGGNRSICRDECRSRLADDTSSVLPPRQNLRHAGLSEHLARALCPL
jgi:hypothetical protein